MHWETEGVARMKILSAISRSPATRSAHAGSGTRDTTQATEDGAADGGGVEVVAMLGDSVIGVTHCFDPRAGRVSRKTWVLFAIGVVSLVAVMFAFCAGIANAAHNDEQYAYETIQLYKPGYAVRPRTLSAEFDWVAVVGLATALLTMTFALARLHKEKANSSVSIGCAPGVDFATERTRAASFILVEPCGEDFAFNIDRSMDGEMIVSGQTTSLAELAARGQTRISPIPANARIRVYAANATFLVSSVSRARPCAAPGFAVDLPFLYSLAGTAAAAAMIALLLFHAVADDSSARIDFAALDETATRFASTTVEVAPPLVAEAVAVGDPAPADGGLSSALSTRLMGSPNSSRVGGRYAMQKHLDKPQLARQQAIELARTAGILGSSTLVQGGAFASLTEVSDISSGFDESDISGGLIGKEAGEVNGNFGLGRSGFGPDSGGEGWGTIGAGPYGTIGASGSCGNRCGIGSGRASAGLSGHTPAVPTVMLCHATSPRVKLCWLDQGDLDKAIIRRYIKRNIPKISYCYEKQLLAKPNLAGTVTSQFFVAPNGRVISSHSSGLDSEVANCVSDVIAGIEFPKSVHGSLTKVNYPFAFRPTGV